MLNFLTKIDSDLRRKFIVPLLGNKMLLNWLQEYKNDNKVDILKNILLNKFMCEKHIHHIYHINIDNDNYEIFANYLLKLFDEYLEKYIQIVNSSK